MRTPAYSNMAVLLSHIILAWISQALHRWVSSSSNVILFSFKTSCENNLKRTNACWSWERDMTWAKINLFKPGLLIWSKCHDGWQGSIYIIRLSLCYIHVFTISSWMLKQFIDLKNVLTSSRLYVCFFEVGTCLAFFSVGLVVTVMFYCSLQ